MLNSLFQRPENPSELADRLKVVASEYIEFARQFKAHGSVSGSLDPGPFDVAEITHWYERREAADTLMAAWDSVRLRLDPYLAEAMPAHDDRHALVRVPAAVLESLAQDDASPWLRAVLLAALMHDTGRWVEERWWGAPGPGVRHARLSFCAAQELLRPFEMPRALREQILYAVGEHSAVMSYEDPAYLRYVRTGDRAQLVGPELILRLTHHLGTHEFPTLLPATANAPSLVLGVLRAQLHARTPQTGWDRHHFRLARLRSARFAWQALSAEQRLFYFDCSRTEEKFPTCPCPSEDIVEALFSEKSPAVPDWSEQEGRALLHYLANTLVQAKGTSRDPRYLSVMNSYLENVPAEEVSRLAVAYAPVLLDRDEETHRTRVALTNLRTHPHFSEDRFIQHVLDDLLARLANAP